MHKPRNGLLLDRNTSFMHNFFNQLPIKSLLSLDLLEFAYELLYALFDFICTFVCFVCFQMLLGHLQIAIPWGLHAKGLTSAQGQMWVRTDHISNVMLQGYSSATRHDG